MQHMHDEQLSSQRLDLVAMQRMHDEQLSAQRLGLTTSVVNFVIMLLEDITGLLATVLRRI